MGRTPVRGTSPSDLADYAYCPRSHWYRTHPPPGGPSVEGVRRAEAGVRYHARTLHATRIRAERGVSYWVVVAMGSLVALGGILWLVF